MAKSEKPPNTVSREDTETTRSSRKKWVLLGFLDIKILFRVFFFPSD